MLFFCSFVFRNLLAYTMGCQLFSYFSSRHALSLLCLRHSLIVLDGLHRNFCFLLFVWLHFSVVGMICCVFHSILVCCFLFFLCERVVVAQGADSCNRLWMNFFRWCMAPVKDLSGFSVFGGSIFLIASVLRLVGMVPLGLILYPSHVISFLLLRIRFCVDLLLGFLCLI